MSTRTIWAEISRGRRAVLVIGVVLSLGAAACGQGAALTPSGAPLIALSATSTPSPETTMMLATQIPALPVFVMATPAPTAHPTAKPTPRPTPKPTPRPTPRPAATPRPVVSNCDPSYVGVCLKMGIGDYDCAGGSGNGPNYVAGPFRVVGPDHFGLDSDHNGIGCA